MELWKLMEMSSEQTPSPVVANNHFLMERVTKGLKEVGSDISGFGSKMAIWNKTGDLDHN